MNKRKVKNIINELFPFLTLLIILIFFEIISHGKMFSTRNVRAIVNDGFMTILGAVGLGFVISQKELDLSIGANLGISCCAAVFAAKINSYLALPVALLTGLGIGLINAILIVKLRINSLIGTIALQFVLNGIMTWILYSGAQGVPFSMLAWDSFQKKLIILIIICIVAYILFEYTIFGKQLRASGTNSEVAKQCGVSVKKIKMAGFIICGLIAGFLGFMSLIRTGTSSTATGSGFEIDALNAVLIGGMPITGGINCRFKSAVLGGLTITILSTGMTMWGAGADIQQVVKGIIFLFAIFLSFDRKNIQIIK